MAIDLYQCGVEARQKQRDGQVRRLIERVAANPDEENHQHVQYGVLRSRESERPGAMNLYISI
jgi:hypothetical protein